MNEFRNLLLARKKEAVEKAGGVTHLARSLRHYGEKITHQAVCKWRAVPAKWLHWVCAFAELKPEYLRPDLVLKPAPSKFNPKLAELQGHVRGQVAALWAERLVRKRFGLGRDFSRQEGRYRRIAIYLAAVSVENASTFGIQNHFGISHTAVAKAKADIELQRESDGQLDVILTDLEREIYEEFEENYGF